MASIASAQSVSLLRHRPFFLYFFASGFSEFSHQIGAVAIGWQIYALTGSAFDLGLVGLAQFVPSALLTFAAGHAADRYDRKRVVLLCQAAQGLTAAFLAWGSFGGWLTVPEIYGAVLIFGTTTAFESPAYSALLPAVAPPGALQRATAISTAAWQVSIISGPALGGLIYALSPGLPYTVMAAFWLLAGLANMLIAVERRVVTDEPTTLATLFAGVGFVRRSPAILGTISLDLFAVLLGGATALMPIYAHDILHTGPWGLGILRGAPAVGALLMTLFLARHPISRRVGIRMFQAVIIFGLATVLFALSHYMWLSILALVVMGASDTISMVIRISLVQLGTPDAMRGRVGGSITCSSTPPTNSASLKAGCWPRYLAPCRRRRWAGSGLCLSHCYG